jgi:hypothetical protein
MKPSRSSRMAVGDAFTFVEVFAALVFLAILVPAIVEGLTLANRVSIVTERGSIAGELAENKMNEILLSSTGASSSVSKSNGDFGADYPGYRWETSTDTWDQDQTNTMTELNVDVFYPVQGAERSVRLTTLVSGTTSI